MKILNAHTVGLHLSGCVYVGRPTKFGNPFLVGVDGTRDDVIQKYEEWVLQQPELIKAIKLELRGKPLICWCAPKRCHAEILMCIANEGEV